MFQDRAGNDYSYDEVEGMVFDSICEAECPGCGAYYTVEPDASFACHECGEQVTSPLIDFGLI